MEDTPVIRAHPLRPQTRRPRDKEIAPTYFRLADFLAVRGLLDEFEVEELTPAELVLSEKTNAIISKIRASKDRRYNGQQRVPHRR